MPRSDEAGQISQVSFDKGLGLGTGYMRGPVKNLAKELISPKTQKELLQDQIEILQNKLDEQIKILQNKLDAINKQLENL